MTTGTAMNEEETLLASHTAIEFAFMHASASRNQHELHNRRPHRMTRQRSPNGASLVVGDAVAHQRIDGSQCLGALGEHLEHAQTRATWVKLCFLCHVVAGQCDDIGATTLHADPAITVHGANLLGLGLPLRFRFLLGLSLWLRQHAKRSRATAIRPLLWAPSDVSDVITPRIHSTVVVSDALCWLRRGRRADR